MAARRTKGKCKYCGKELTAASMGKHLGTCTKRSDAVTAQSGDKKCGYFDLAVYAKHNKNYWLFIEIKDTATLKDLDQFLRDIWLECCGHLSGFDVYGQRYESVPSDDFCFGSRPLGMNHKLHTIFEEGMIIGYEYDYGSATELVIQVGSHRIGPNRRNKIIILSRNNPVEIICSACKKEPAEVICAECFYEGEGFLCEDCAAEHECDYEMQMPLCNSPRAGVCGYTGSEIYPDEFTPD